MGLELEQSKIHSPFRLHSCLLVIGLYLFFQNPADAQEILPMPRCCDSLPFKRAIIFSGEGTDFTCHIGMYDAAVEAGLAPDLIIGTSGGSIAALIISTYPDRLERNKFIASSRLHEMLLSIQIEHPRVLLESGRALRWRIRGIGLAPHPPDIFTRPIASIPGNFGLTESDHPFEVNPKGPKVLLVAGELHFDTSKGLRSSQKLFTETWFTDPDTARYIPADMPTIGTVYPNSAVCPLGQTVTDVKLSEAMMASIAEPHVFLPVTVGGKTYTGGVINLHAIELAGRLAEEVITPKMGHHSRVATNVIHSVFEYEPNQRMDAVNQFPVKYRVDFSDATPALKGNSFWFSAKFVNNESEVQSVLSGDYKKDRAYLIPRYRIVDNVPASFEEYQKKINAQWQYGYDRAKMAFSTPK